MLKIYCEKCLFFCVTLSTNSRQTFGIFSFSFIMVKSQNKFAITFDIAVLWFGKDAIVIFRFYFCLVFQVQMHENLSLNHIWFG